jgi:hypothetical protein
MQSMLWGALLSIIGLILVVLLYTDWIEYLRTRLLCPWMELSVGKLRYAKLAFVLVIVSARFP